MTFFGVITELDSSGFGFLCQETGPGANELDDRIFFHASVVVGPVQFDDLREGQPVDFAFGRDRSNKGPRARMVRARSGPAEAAARIYTKWKHRRADALKERVCES